MKKYPTIALAIATLFGSAAVTVQAEDKKDKPTVDERFEFLDTDKNDELSLKEFSKARFLDDEGRKHVVNIFEKYDKNSDEALRPREFETGMEIHHPHHHHRHHHHAKGKDVGKGKASGKSGGGKSGGSKGGKGGK